MLIRYVDERELTYADNCEILEPSSLRDKIAERAVRIRERQKKKTDGLS